MSSFHTYPSIFNIGHKAISALLKGQVTVEEKIDGSQFSFGLFVTTGDNGTISETGGGPLLELKVRSKGAVMHPDAPEKMFTKAVETVKAIQDQLHVGWTYRGEYLRSPKHNALAYDRVPKGHIIIFDINIGEEAYLSYEDKRDEAERLGLEVVPRLFQGTIENIEDFRGFLSTTSVLGGQQIEGVVVKPLNYDLFGRDHKCLMGKFVSESYKEVHSQAWKSDNPTNKDVLEILGATYGTQARWAKAVQHLREAGKIEDDPRDIGLLMREIPADVEKECAEEIKEKLYQWAWPHVRRMLTRGVPAWYKDLLLRGAFEAEDVERKEVSLGPLAS